MNKKIPIFVLILLLVILLPFLFLSCNMNGNMALKNSKNSLVENYSSYEKELSSLGYKSEIITEDGKKVLAVYTEYITFKFDKQNSCTAEFYNKSVISSKYHGEMYASNIGEEQIEVTITETYQNMDFKYSCSYDPSGFDTIIIDSPDYDKNDREIKSLINGEYKLSDIYAQMKSINNNLNQLLKNSK